MTPITPSRARRVLIIDDSRDILMLVRRLLSSAGYEVKELSSAHDMEAAIAAFSPDLVLCDVMMPGRDGLSVCRSVRANPATSSLPVVLMSAKDFSSDKRAALDAGAAAYVVKPFDPEVLLATVEDVLSTGCSVRIWGCRGSIATPEKAAGRYGGNTTCIDLMMPGHQHLIFDAGTGIRLLGNSLEGQSPVRAALLLTHFHWDHIQGLPFFSPFFARGNEIHLYGPAGSNDALLGSIEGQMGGAFFPISPDSFLSTVRYVGLQEQSFDVFGISVSALYVNHPGTTLAYRVNFGNRSIVFSPDNEIVPETVESELSGEALRLARFAEGATLLIHDCQYSRAAYPARRGWGHSCSETLAAVAAHAGVGRVLLFHHDPNNSDEDVESVHHEFRGYLEDRGAELPSEPAREGATYEV